GRSPGACWATCSIHCRGSSGSPPARRLCCASIVAQVGRVWPSLPWSGLAWPWVVKSCSRRPLRSRGVPSAGGCSPYFRQRRRWPSSYWRRFCSRVARLERRQVQLEQPRGVGTQQLLFQRPAEPQIEDGLDGGLEAIRDVGKAAAEDDTVLEL